MIYQQYKTAITRAYADHKSVAELHAVAKAYREWLASLKLDPKLRNPLVEPIAAIEEAFQGLLSDNRV